MPEHATPDLPQVFEFESHPIRVFADEQGNPWFVANDVCRILDYANPRQAVQKLCREDGVSKRDTIDGLGRPQPLNVISEGNLYRLIIKSNKPQAAPFESWVCDEVLPAIRKTGRYERRPGDVFGEAGNPFDQVCPHTLDSLRRINRGLAQAYLVKLGITPDFIAGVLGHPEAAGFPGRGDADRVPLDLLRERVPQYATAQDELCWYLLRKDWETVCQGYSATRTARYLADLGLLRHDEGKLTMKAGRGLFGGQVRGRRPYVYAVRKGLAEGAGLPALH